MSFKTLLIATALSLSVLTPTFADTITIQGTGVVTTAPDIAYINLGVNSNAKTARTALDKNNKAMNNIIVAIKKAGIENRDIQTSNFSINPSYRNTKSNGNQTEITSYNVYNTLNITIRDLDKLGPILDKVVTLGSNRVNNIQFSISNPQPLKDKARAVAAKDAKRRAQIYANALGINIGKIIEITENNSGSGIYNDHATIMRKASLSASTPIEAGEQSVSASVTVTWEIKQ